MSKLNIIEEQIEALKLEATRIKECHVQIGEYIFNLYEDGWLHDEQLKKDVAKIINGVMLNNDLSGAASAFAVVQSRLDEIASRVGKCHE